MTPQSSPSELPPRLGPYTLGPALGAGTDAVVVRARDTLIGSDVAIKVRNLADPLLGEQFLHAGRTLLGVIHPAVIGVRDLGLTPDGRPYLVMELARDCLAGRLRTAGRADSPALLAVVAALAEGLGALHRLGIVHRAVTPANLLLKAQSWADETPRGASIVGPDERIVLGDLGLADSGAGSAREFRAPEQLQPGGRVDAHADVYGASAVLWTLLVGRVPPAVAAVAVEVQSIPAQWRDFFRIGMAADAGSRFPDMDTWAQAARQMLGGQSDSGAPARTAGGQGGDLGPYKGLAAFQPEDAALYFGRTELADTLLERLARHPVLVVVGASGSGKSSLVRAGLIPRVRSGGLPEGGDLPTCLFTPSGRPLRLLAEQLTGAGGLGLSAELLRAQPTVAPAGMPRPVLLVIDQFEELFTLCRDPGEQDAFLDVLAALSDAADPKARIVLAVRAEFYGECTARPWLAAAANHNQVLVEPMSRADLRQAIERPAREVGLRLQDGLSQRLLDDLGDSPNPLPRLAHTLAQTWLRREDRLLTLAGYEAGGPVLAAVERTAEEVWAALDEHDQVAARRLMLSLVRSGDGTPDTARVLDWSDLTSHQRQLLGRFVQAGLLTLDTGGVRYAHEAVLYSWGRLAGWLAESREELRVGAHMEQAAARWERQGRNGELLLRGMALTAALDWRDRQCGDLPYQVATFLTEAEFASLDAQARERTAAARSARARRRTVATLGTTTVLALLAVAGSGLGALRSDGEAQTVAANAYADQAQSSPAPPRVIPLAQIADLQGPGGVLALSADASTLAVGLADGSVRVLDAAGVERAVLRAGTAPIGAVAFLGTDRVIAGDATGTLRIWPAAGGAVLAERPGAHRGAVGGIAVAADRVLSVGGDGAVRLWSTDLTYHQKFALLGGELTDVATDAALVTVVAVSRTGQVRRWSPESGAIEQITGPGATAWGVAIAGDTLAVARADGLLSAWTLQDPMAQHPAARWERGAHTGGANDVAVSWPGVLVTAAGDGRLRFWDATTGNAVGSALAAGTSGLRQVAAAPDGTVWAVDRDGKVFRSGHALAQ